MKRDYITEIEMLKIRSNFTFSKYSWNHRLTTLRNSFLDIVKNKPNKELLKYIPISIVACYESFLKASIAELIDFGEPFSKNVGKLNQSREIKFDFEVVNAIQNKRLTVGEFIAHFSPCKRITDINFNLSSLINCDLFKEIQGFKMKTLNEEKFELFIKFNNESDLIFKSVSRTFELRHIFCHEFADNVVIDETEILQCLDHAYLFLNQISSFLIHLSYPGYPLTQLDINIQSAENFKESDLELSKLIIDIIAKNHEDYVFDKDLFEEMIELWRKYRDSLALFDGLQGKGGSIYSCLITGSKTSTTNLFINELKGRFQMDKIII